MLYYRFIFPGGPMNKKSQLLLVMIGLSLGGCATMFSKKSDDITIKSDPPGADVYMGLTKICVTPCTFPMERKTFEMPDVSVRKVGYGTVKVDVQKTIETTALYNLGFITTSGGITS